MWKRLPTRVIEGISFVNNFAALAIQMNSLNAHRANTLEGKLPEEHEESYKQMINCPHEKPNHPT